MIVLYKNKKTEKLCSDFDEMKKFFSSAVTAQKLAVLMTNLKSVDHINDFATVPVFKNIAITNCMAIKRGYIA